MRYENMMRTCTLAILLAITIPVTAEPVHVEYIDGRELQAEWLGVSDSEELHLATDAGESTIPFDEIATLTFELRARRMPGDGDQLHAADGGMLIGSVKTDDPGSVAFESSVNGEINVAFDHIAGVRFNPAADEARAKLLFVEALADRLLAQDVLITRGEEAKSLRGRLVDVHADGGTFEFGGKERTFARDKVFGVVLATGAGASPTPQVRVLLADGSSLGGRLVGGDTGSLRIESTMGVALSLSLTDVTGLRFHSDRIVYVSDLEAANESTEGILHKHWPMRRDVNVANEPPRLAGRVYEKNIGCHSHSRITFELARAYETFAATVGIDDAARPHGAVTFRVRGDDKVLFDSGVITGRDEPQKVRVDMQGVKILTLEVDYGDSLDLADWANWAGARLIKARE